MKTAIITIAAMFVAVWVQNKSVTPVPDNLLLMNVEALAGPGGGGGDEGGENPGKPGDKPDPIPCWTEFYMDRIHETEVPFRVCGNEPAPGEGPARIGTTKCVKVYAYYLPVASSGSTCVKEEKPS